MPSIHSRPEPDWGGLGGLRDSHHRNEVPVSALGGWWNVPVPNNDTNFTDTDMEALMSAAPGHEPYRAPRHDTDPYQALGIELDDFEREVMDARVISGLSYRQAGRVLGVSYSTVYRVHKSVLERIRKQMGVDDE